MAQLPDATHALIVTLCKEGDEFMDRSQFELARAKYIQALKLLPEDHREWNAATWIYVAVGDTHFLTENYGKAMKCFSNAVQCPGGFGNPYIHLRLGQLHFENNELDRSADELTRAYGLAGAEIFMEDDPKYLAFLETRIII